MRTKSLARRVSLVTLLVVGIGGSPVLAMESSDEQGQQKTMASAERLVNINSASVSALAKGLAGVGRVKAKRIVSHRKEHGPFGSAEELMEIKGISQRIITVNKTRITLE